MMKKINYKSEWRFANASVRCIPTNRVCANEPNLHNEPQIQLLPGGSIDYAFYDNQAKDIRSKTAHGFLKSLFHVMGAWY